MSSQALKPEGKYTLTLLFKFEYSHPERYFLKFFWCSEVTFCDLLSVLNDPTMDDFSVPVPRGIDTLGYVR